MTYLCQWRTHENMTAAFATEAEAEAHRAALALRQVAAVVFEVDDDGGQG